MNRDSFVTIYFLDEHENVIKRVELTSFKRQALSKVIANMPEAKSIQICYSDDYNECECKFCNDYKECECQYCNDDDESDDD